MNIDNRFKAKKVLILGLGTNQGGVGTAKFFAEAGATVKVTDLKTTDQLKDSINRLLKFPQITYTLGGHKYEDLDWADLIIRNPAVKPDNPYLRYAKEHGKTVEMDLGIFFQFVSPSQVLGVTGTKGKSTTASLIYEVLKAAGKEVLFAGNIGRSLLETISHVADNSLVILELSSFQLQTCKQHQISPKYALITNIYPDHLNYHDSMEDYVNAKRTIAQYQNQDGVVFLRKNDPETSKPEFLQDLPGQIRFFSKNDLPKNFTPKLLGDHNKENFAAGLAVAGFFQVNEQTALQIMADFPAVELRLQFIKKWQGIKIYNDSAATNPESTIRALFSLPNSILIAGGVNKGLSFAKLAQAIDDKAKAVYFLAGDASKEIQNSMRQKDKTKGVFDNLERLVSAVKQAAKRGDIILFSPGAASFNLFKNEFDRGRQFNKVIDKMFP